MLWRLQLTEYDFTVIHKADKFNTNADALSRVQIDSADTPETQQYLVTTRSQTQSKSIPKGNSTAMNIDKNKSTDNLNNNDELKDDIIKLLDRNLIIQTLRQYHDAPIGGH